jgi:hypothetical protein
MINNLNNYNLISQTKIHNQKFNKKIYKQINKRIHKDLKIINKTNDL